MRSNAYGRWLPKSKNLQQKTSTYRLRSVTVANALTFNVKESSFKPVYRRTLKGSLRRKRVKQRTGDIVVCIVLTLLAIAMYIILVVTHR